MATMELLRYQMMLPLLAHSSSLLQMPSSHARHRQWSSLAASRPVRLPLRLWCNRQLLVCPYDFQTGR